MSTSTELTVHQRAAVALKSDKARVELMALAASSQGITAITNRAGREECHGAAMAATKARTAISQAGKSARDDATRFSKAVIAEEAALIAIIQPEESRLKELRDEWDEKEKAQKAAKAEAERLRVLEITQRIALMRKLAAERKALEGRRAKFEAEQAAARAVEDAARRERESKERAEQDAKDAASRAELNRRLAEEKKAAEAERMAGKELFDARAKIIDLAESITDTSVLAEMFDAASAVANNAAKLKAD